MMRLLRLEAVWGSVMAYMGLLCLMGVMALSQADAAESTPVVTSHTRASLVSAVDALPSGTASQPDKTGAELLLGLRLQLQPGWHSYWQNPGDAGEPTHIRITISGARSGVGEQIEWPVPERLSEGELMAYGYRGDVLLPVKVPLEGQGNGVVQITAQADWLVCADICIPESGHFTLTLPAREAATTPPSAEADLFRKAEAELPQPSPFTASITAEGRLVLYGAGLASDTVRQAWFLPLEGGVIAHAATQAVTVEPGYVQIQLKPDAYAQPPFWQKSLAGVVVLVDGAGNRSAIHITAMPSPHDVRQKAGQSVFGVLLAAFLGGMILNLMPCVFPVLAMKIVSFAAMGGVEWRSRVQSATWYGLGVMGSFVAFGIGMMALRYGGATLGWGFQFQSPAFVVGMGWLLFLMALTLGGVFHITGGRLVGMAGQRMAGHGPVRELLTGLLAVIVATPCTAPFMGVAIAAAFNGPVWMGGVIFLVMGAGLALPYVMLALMPGVAGYIPRPGPWMERVKQGLAFPLFASFVWLLWVAVQQSGPDIVVVMGGGAVLLGLGGWFYGLAQQAAMTSRTPRFMWFCRGVAILCLLLCALGLMQVRTHARDVAQKNAPSFIEPFSEKRLAALRAAGRPVFVDMTASWCITCMVNERVALDVPSVQQAFHEHGVTLLRGDWTQHDEAITAFLRAHGREGVPFYLYLSPQGKEVLLPQILTPTLVQQIIGETPFKAEQ
ncbi:protein-disulfide reductase DsbD family protein [Bombella pollinis]|uniref:Protein-disulfide reductase DsbD family protein n=1 Tax=Bombella pollinis TaxID=2967337 RepID=A0ABT3WMP7_9PROT|nr:protein-disulfide reductase DsbD domain-containing protein [Bombella pollinis]MCX5619037.1 protein-disulfide reductase DsbD family protein [Bombella pollinis]